MPLGPPVIVAGVVRPVDAKSVENKTETPGGLRVLR
jgi:hypothetical protein